MSAKSDSNQMLSFCLTPQLQAVISVDELISLATIETANIAPMPDTPQSVMGIYSHRGTITWIIDLPYLLGLTPLYLANTRQACSIIFLRAGEKIVGFAVHQVGQMLTLSESQLQRGYTNPGAQRLNWCINGIYNTHTGTMISMQGKKIFELLKISELTL